MTFAFLNGIILPESEALLPLNDRGFLLGDGLFETLRVANGKALFITRHLERLWRGAAFLKIQPPFSQAAMAEHAAKLVAANRALNAILRITLTRGAGGRGYSPIQAATPTLAMTLHPLPHPTEFWRLATTSFRINADDLLASFKTTSRVMNVLARAEAEARGSDEALLLDSTGNVLETASGNIFWVDRGVVCTPPANRGVLPGITRATVIELCESLALPCRECFTTPEQMADAEGVFVTQSALGIVTATHLDGKPLARWSIEKELRAAYANIFNV